MRKILVTICTALVATVCAVADEFAVDGIRYGTLGSSTVCVIQNDDKYSGDIAVPKRVDNNGKTYKVTAISDLAFNDCAGLKTVSLPSSVTSIGRFAFAGCTGLASVKLPASVTSIGVYAFYHCTALTSVTLSASITSVESGTFDGCEKLSFITIPETVTSIGDYAFTGCTSLKEITIPNSVVSIGGQAFSNCTGLTGLTLGVSVADIGEYAFDYCDNITEITFLTDKPFAISPNVFTCQKAATLSVRTECVSTFKRLEGWQDFLMIKTADTKPNLLDNNGDGVVNTADVVNIYNYIIYGTTE